MTLMTKRDVNVFNVPPMTSAKGHCAEDWRGKQMWTGKCRVMMENSNRLKIQLVNEDGTMFAQSMIPNENTDAFIQRCYDSSRFFSIQLVSEQGQKAMVGIGFPDRNDSFDFVAAIDDFKKQVRQDKGLDMPHTEHSDQDFKLKEGEKITLQLTGMKAPAQPIVKKGGGLKKLAPPPKAGAPAAPQTDLFGSESQNPCDLLGSMTINQPASQEGGNLLDF